MLTCLEVGYNWLNEEEACADVHITGMHPSNRGNRGGLHLYCKSVTV